MAISNPESFRAEARAQFECAVCGSTGSWDPHHVVQRQHLRRLGLPEWDTRNALRLCQDCHTAHTSHYRKVPLVKILDENVAYAYEALGTAAFDYFARRYSGADPRVTVHGPVLQEAA